MARLRLHYCAFILVGLLAGCGSSDHTDVQPTTTSATLSSRSFDFGKNIVGTPNTKTVVEVTNTGALPLTLHPVLTGDPGFSLDAANSCKAQLPPGMNCSIVATYSPQTASLPAQQTAILNLNLGNVAPNTPESVSLAGTSAALTAGTVTATANPQVALYTITPPFAGNVTVSFGPTTSYGKQTWSVPTPNGGGPVSIEVAGMLANTAYHMSASITFENGLTVNDTDHTFTTGALPPHIQSQIAATTSAGQTPQAGIEMTNPISGSPAIVATDLSGNVIWVYNPPDALGGAQWYSPKQLDNGDYIALASVASSTVINTPVPTGAANLVREFDLAGNTIKQITMAQLNTALAGANYNLTLIAFHHNVTVLPNGHWLLLANTIKSVVLNGQTTPTNVLGDVIVDLDTNLNPVWVWNEFDHLDVNRHPTGFPDWTHTNDVVYSKDDGNLLVSMRHQSWVVKVDYNNGAGAGDILWRLGEGGDFTLQGGTDPTDWFYGQHGLHFTTTNTTGIFGLILMDNGNFRHFPAGVTCGTGSAPPCLYSTIPILQINETTKTVTFKFHQILPPNLYNFFGGNAEMLANGDIEYNLCGQANTSSQIFEVTNQETPQTVWNMKLTNNYFYRGFRLPSLYPGVQW